MGSETNSSFYLGFLILPPAKREALADVYAFCREVDDIVDSGSLTREQASRELDRWRAEIGRMYEGRAESVLAHRLQSRLKAFPFPKDAFLGLVDGCAMDLERSRYATYSQLEDYMTGVASCAGLLSIEVFGYRQASAKEYARKLGHAFQLTNILRDVGADLEKGRVYLPLADLERFGCRIEDIEARRAAPAFLQLVNFEIERIRSLYREARRALDPADASSMRPAEVMAGVYESLLEEIAKSPAEVLTRRIRLGRLRKLAAGLRGWWHDPKEMSYAQG